MVIATLGLNVHLTNSFYTYKNRFHQVWGRILYLMLVAGSIVAIGYSIVLTIILNEISGIAKFVTIIGSAIPIVLSANSTMSQHYFPLMYKPMPLVIRNLIASLSGMAVSFVVIYYLRLGYLGWILGTLVSAVLGFVLFVKPLWIDQKIKPIPTYKKKRLQNWLKVALPIIPHTLGFVFLGSSDRIIMNFLNVPVSDIGIYSNGYQMGDYVMVITSALILAVAPRIQELYRTKQFIQIRKLYIMCQTLVLLFVFIVAIWMPQIYQFLIRNPELYPANKIATVICFANIVYPFYSFISTVAFIKEKTIQILWLVFIPGALNIVLNLIFIPIYGYQAAIYTTLAAYWSQLLIPFIIKFHGEAQVELLQSKYFTIPLLAIIGIISSAAYFIADMSLLVKILVSIGFLATLALYINRSRHIVI